MMVVPSREVVESFTFPGARHNGSASLALNKHYGATGIDPGDVMSFNLCLCTADGESYRKDAAP
jgi:hypothetical protein